MLNVAGVSKAFGPKSLFEDLTFQIFERERVCLVGPNGAGKTTLFRIITGEISPDEGTVELVGDRTLGYLEQETDNLRGQSVIEAVVSAAPSMTQAGVELKEIEARLAEDHGLLDRHGELQARFESLGGYRAEADAFQVLHGLGFKDDQAAGRVDSLSGGWLMRVALARLLIAKPDLLLLDEPTNHLDLESVRWLEAFLRTYQGAVMIISHDRDFMNAVATRIIELDGGRIESYTGDYEAFVDARHLRIEQLLKQAKLNDARVAQLQTFVDRFRYKKSKAKQAQAKLKQISRIERIDVPSARRKKMGLTFPSPKHHSDRPVVLEKITFGYSETEPIYEDLTIWLERGMKAALVGPNGAGKTTLLKLFAGVLKPQKGERMVPPSAGVGYFAQHQIESLNPNNRVIEEVASATTGEVVNLRGLLGRFLFSGDDVDKPVAVLSGGERTRLALCKLLLTSFNVLCVDEPTNHLDVGARDVLEEALEEYEGALVLITHDRHLIRSVANTIIEVAPGGEVRIFRDDYERYLELVEQEAPAPVAKVATESSSKQRKREQAQARQATAEARKQLHRMESALEKVRSELEELNERLSDAAFYAAGGDEVSKAVKRHAELDAKVRRLEDDWLAAAEALDAAG